MSTLTDFLTGIADAIRSKTGESGSILATDFASKISAIQVGVDTSDATATAENIDSGKTAYVNGQKVTGTSTKVDTSDATAAAGDIASGKTAYVNGEKVTGALIQKLSTLRYVGTTTCSVSKAYTPTSILSLSINAFSGVSSGDLLIGQSGYCVGWAYGYSVYVGGTTNRNLTNPVETFEIYRP